LIKLDDASTVYRTPAVKESFKALAEEIGKL
jgi:tRNA (guanine-N7-)-methyltransferase